MLNAVVDTNVFIRGLLGSGLNRAVILALRNAKFNLLISTEIFDELLDVVTRNKFRNSFSDAEVYTLIEIIKVQAKFVAPRHKVTACRDIEDRKVLECALEGADMIVTSDDDLLCLRVFHSIPILTPAKFLQKLNG